MVLSIIIVNWNVKHYLERCLLSIIKNTPDLDYEIIVVDNNSTRDDSKRFLAGFKTDANVKIILNNQNLGFAKANNQGIKQAQGEYILLLNPDTEIIEKGSLAKAVELMEENKDWGVLGCHLLEADKQTQLSVRSFPKLIPQIMIFLKLHHLFPNAKALENYFLPHFNYKETASVDQVMGAFLLTKREVLSKIGMLDEKFYIWFEEVDFCRRTKKAGWKVVYSHEPTIIHYGSQCFAQVLSLAKQKIYNRSAIYYFRKHHPLKAGILSFFLPLSLFLACISDLFFGIKRVLTKQNVKVH
ncbi:hypothetical protein B6D52_01270 [Candidatus Parcubacteria bacterium 4484_255]|nr:MAG: hypothetical protein B6D52_01270 [Candidatus Parcubacteria bacterium 4484_255]